MYTYLHGFSPLYSPFTPALMLALLPFLPFLIMIALWTVVLKGFALWHAARGGQRNWFIALLVINTLGILEIIYLIWFRPSSLPRSDTPAHPSSAQA